MTDPRHDDDPLQRRSSIDPYFDIVAPNLDHMSRDSFGGANRRRVVRALAILGAIVVVSGGAVLVGVLLA